MSGRLCPEPRVRIGSSTRATPGGRCRVGVRGGRAPSRLGMVTGLTDPADPSVCELVSLWIDPQARRRELGGGLTNALCERAAASGFENVQLWVTTTNESAVQTYEAVGFLPTGHTRPLPSSPDLSMTVCIRTL